jgi:hypothetical protein
MLVAGIETAIELVDRGRLVAARLIAAFEFEVQGEGLLQAWRLATKL